MPRRPTRTTTTTKSSRGARASRKEEVVKEEMRRTRPRRKSRTTAAKESTPKRQTDRPRRRKPTNFANADTRTVILAMKPGTANSLRSILAKARWEDEPGLTAIVKELEDQLTEMGMPL